MTPTARGLAIGLAIVMVQLNMPPAATIPCQHCGLPVPAARQRGGDSARFCCFGCRLVHDLGAAASDATDDARPNTLLLRLGLGIFLAMNLMAFSSYFYSQHVYDGAADHPQYSTLAGFLAWLLLFLCTLVMVLIGSPLASDAVDRFVVGVTSAPRLRFSLDANSLILVGVAAAYVVSVISTLRGAGPLYFDTAAMVLVLLALGGYLDSRAKQKAASDADALLAAAPTRAFVERNGKIVELDLTQVQIGDRVRIRPGEAVPVDGVVADGASHVVESMLTGESLPRAVQPGDRVLAGSICLDGQIHVTAAATGDDRVVAQIRQLLGEARRQQPAIQRLADRVSAVFVPGVIAVAAAVFFACLAADEAEEGLLRALSVLLISCPCALGLAAPLATWTAMARAAQRGILFFSAATIERAAAAAVVLFDKTGTLTCHEMELINIATADGLAADDALRLAAAVESASAHPIAKALVRAAAQRGLALPAAADARALPGIGVEALVEGRRCRVGSDRLLAQIQVWHGHNCSTQPQLLATHTASDIASPLLDLHSDLPTVYLLDDRGVLARFTLAERVREDLPETIARLKQAGLHLHILTGDQRGPASRLARQLNVRVSARLLPADKLNHVARWRRRGRRPVVFVGDGINDAPALAAADVGIAVGAATDLARHAGHVHLIGDRLTLVPLTLAIARDTMRRIRLNLLWAFGYNVIGITLAALGLLNPIFAASTMVVSSLVIVITSRRAGQVDDDMPTLAGGPKAPVERPEIVNNSGANCDAAPLMNCALSTPQFDSGGTT